jgi:hypothetical protein
VTFAELAIRLERHSRSAALVELFGRFVAAREQHPHRPILVTRTFGGVMAHVGDGNVELDEVLLQDLLHWGLVRRQSFGSRAAEQLVVPADAVTFYGWFLAQRGTPIGAVEDEVLKLVDGEGFSTRHPTAAKALGEAFDLVRRGVADVADLAEVGQHLRGAVVDVVAASAGLPAPHENVAAATKSARKAAAERGDEAVVALITLTEKVTSFDQAITHARDEQAQGRPVADAETVRRAAFLTAVACYELDRRPIAGSS